MWEPVERPGYFGSRRDELHREYDERFGAGGWCLRWDLAGRYVETDYALVLYEEAYSRFLDERPEVLDALVTEASEVYDDDPTNIDSGLDYARQETGRTHLQDIAVRRCLARRGRWFTGDAPLQIRDSLGEHPLSMTLSPGRVPFHLPRLIVAPELTGWWSPASVESFYQSNKTLMRRA